MQGDNQPFRVVAPNLQSGSQATKPKLLTIDAAWQFTPLTFSPVQPATSLPVPNLAAFSQNGQLATKAERANAAQKPTQAIQEELQDLLRPNALAELSVSYAR
jgi:hypothetical protein